MATTWTNTSKTDLILPHGTVVPAGLTVLDRLDGPYDGEDKFPALNPTNHPIVKFLMDSGVLKRATDSRADDTAVVSLFNGGPVANSANLPTTPAPAAAAPASDPGPGSNPPVAPVTTPAVVKVDDGTHEVRVGDEVIASGLTKKEAEALAADPSSAKSA